MADRMRAVSWSQRRARVEELIARHEREKVSFKQIAAESGIVLPTLYSWIQRLRREQCTTTTRSVQPGFVELGAAEVGGDEHSSGVELVLPSGLRVRLDASFHQPTLKRLLAALA